MVVCAFTNCFQLILLIINNMGSIFSKKAEVGPRIVHARSPDKNADYSTNVVVNTKYTVWNFIPMNLYEQFSRFMNVYFLVIGLLQLQPSITAVNPATTLVPLVIIFGISALKEAIDDYGRYKADKTANNAKYTVIKNGKQQKVLSKEIHVGDLILLQDDDKLPCDCVILWTSEVEGGCYTMTANLDGESDLKPRSAAPLTQEQGFAAASKFSGIVECAAPNPEVYKFDSRIKSSQNEAWSPLDVRNTLWQSTQMKNTKEAILMAVYCGNDTKIGQNKADAPFKWTKLDKFINRLTIFIFIVQFLAVATFGVIGLAWLFKEGFDMDYLDFDRQQPWYEYVKIPVRFLLLNSLMIPISLKVSLDIVKLYYAKLVDWDIELYHAPDDLPAKAVNTSIGEDLGQIEHVFADKTGTLTENVMRFHKCSIGGVCYPPVSSPPQTSAYSAPQLIDRAKRDDTAERIFARALALCHNAVPSDDHDKNVVLASGALPKAATNDEDDENELNSLTINTHSGFNNNKTNNNNNNNTTNDDDDGDDDDDAMPEYESSSPDELALLAAACRLGAVFVHRERAKVGLQMYDVDGGAPRDESYEWLAELAFSSDRKRMSVVVRDEAGVLWLYSKGADNVMLPRLAANQSILDDTVSHCEAFAATGLRTLIIARRRLDNAFFVEWNKRHAEAAAALDQREEKLAAVYEELETDLELLGATAIEDKLQDGVPETIQLMRDAGCRVWMLTGDKYSTALQISVSCNLVSKIEDRKIPGNAPLEQQYGIQEISGDDLASTQTSVTQAVRKWKQGQLAAKFSVIVRGSTLAFVLQDAAIKADFADVCLAASTVVCCRVTPAQKAQVVAIAKERGALTLAIGDGGNDVGMIQEAHVGVGIAGHEGLQAARAADYAVGRFSTLSRLLLIHGRYAYLRTAWIAQYSFYKSLIICVLQIFFAFVSGFSGASLFDTFSLTTYNAGFTNFYTICYALEKDVKQSSVLAVPQLYSDCQNSKACNARTFLQWALRAVLQGAFMFYVLVYQQSSWFSNTGQPGDQQQALVATFIALLAVQSGTLYIESHTLTVINQVVIVGSFLVYFPAIWLLSALGFTDAWPAVMHVCGAPEFWFRLVLVLTGCLAPVVAVRYWKQQVQPRLHERVQRIEKMPAALARRLLEGVGDAIGYGSAGDTLLSPSGSLRGSRSSLLRHAMDDGDDDFFDSNSALDGGEDAPLLTRKQL